MMKLGRIPPASSEAVRKSMKGNRGKDTRLELRLRAGLAGKGIGGYRCNFKVEGTRVDVAFQSKRVAVLAHGCFWHSCPICNLGIPSSHRGYWIRKFRINARRDERIRSQLAAAGWHVAEVWEHEVDENLGAVVRRIEGLVGARTT
jgi:DNA mismatch endonuclease, patch repair protein